VAQPATPILRDARVWAFVVANALSMVGYSLWTNWTTLYLVDARGLSLDRAKWFAAVPPAAALAGGFAGGWFSLRLISRGANAPAARFRACLLASLIALAALAVPAAPTPALATAAIAASVFAISAFSVNMYTLPLDVFGGARAAFAVSILVSSYGAVQAIVSPLFGKSIDAFGYSPVIAVAAFTPLLACIPLWKSGAVR
jgi:ACS family hexuronate transporter-like MFS transporter